MSLRFDEQAFTEPSYDEEGGPLAMEGEKSLRKSNENRQLLLSLPPSFCLAKIHLAAKQDGGKDK